MPPLLRDRVGSGWRHWTPKSGEDAQKLFSDRFRESAARIWPAYMDDTRTLDQAATDLVSEMRQGPKLVIGH